LGRPIVFHYFFTAASRHVNPLRCGEREAAVSMVAHDPEHDPRTIRLDDFEIRLSEGLVMAGGEVLTLSVREFQLLVALVDRAGGIMRRDELCQAVWEHELRPGDRSVDVYVSKLRAKLEAAAPGRQFIHTHPGFGYRFQLQALPETDNQQPTAAKTRTVAEHRIAPARADEAATA
jgi:DNA-binding response OmpR family regulator